MSPSPHTEDTLVQQTTATTASQGIAAANQERHALMRDGVQVGLRNHAGDPVHERLRVFDFDEPANSHFLCVWEL